MPALAVLLALVAVGGIAFAVPLAVVAFAGQLELGRMARIGRAAVVPGALVAAAGPLAALFADDRDWLPAAALAAIVAAGALSAALAPAGRRRLAAAVGAGGALWLGGCLFHAVALRELSDGALLVMNVLLATFLGDTAAQLAGTAFGRRKLAPAISPNKTVEGLAAGIAAGTLACAAFVLATQSDRFSPAAALALGLACALAAPAGDLLESALKRRAGVKDSGRAFGAHGGVLDRVDAVIAAAVAGYYVVSAVS